MPIQSIVRASDILSLFSIENPVWGTNEIARALEISKTTISSLVRTLAEIGLLQKDPQTRKYHLGIRAFEIGANFSATSEIHQKSIRKVHDLEDKTGLIIRMGIWDLDSVIIILERTPNFRFIRPPRKIGPRIMAYCTSMGRVFLAFQDKNFVETYLDQTELLPLTPLTKITKKEILVELERIRQRGYALNDREVSLNHANLSCPIFNASGDVAACLSLTGDPKRLVEEEREKLVRILQEAAEDISVSLGHSMTSMATISNNYQRRMS
jgi:DNA-binding IclR family transcriptional regulator